MLPNDNGDDNDAIILPLFLVFPMGVQLQGLLNELTVQEDDSRVNHFWKGEMWPARVGLIHARHVQNTRGAGANN